MTTPDASTTWPTRSPRPCGRRGSRRACGAPTPRPAGRSGCGWPSRCGRSTSGCSGSTAADRTATTARRLYPYRTWRLPPGSAAGLYRDERRPGSRDLQSKPKADTTGGQILDREMVDAGLCELLRVVEGEPARRRELDRLQRGRTDLTGRPGESAGVHACAD